LEEDVYVDSTGAIDQIENCVFQYIKQHGFKKHGRTLHRFVNEDISQVVHFQCGQAYSSQTHLMWVNLGIRVPESYERAFFPSSLKKYYNEYECNIRSRLGSINGKNAKTFDLTKTIGDITEEILYDIEHKVVPVFDILSSREAILEHRRNYPDFDTVSNHLILLEESMIYGHLGDIDQAKRIFDQYYKMSVDEYNDKMVNGTKEYMTKGCVTNYFGKTYVATEDGYVTIYGASHGHIDFLDELAKKLGIS